MGWLVDFGMATPAERKPDRRGTRGFRAPEVLRGSLIQTTGNLMTWCQAWQTFDTAIDIWSAGIVFLTLLCRGKVDKRISFPASDKAAAETLGLYFGQDYSRENKGLFFSLLRLAFFILFAFLIH